MKTKEEILRTLEQLKKEIKASFKAKEIGVFGSVIRKEQRETSDIDILVDFEDGADIFDLVGLALFLEERFNQKVDVVPKEDLRKELRESVLKEVVYL